MLIPSFSPRGTPPSLTYTDFAASTSDTSSYTFSTVAIGTAAADRLVVVCVQTHRDGSQTHRSATGVTLDGNAMASVGSNSEGWNYGGVDYGAENSVWSYNLAAGTTADVVVTLSGTADGCSIRVYTITNYKSATANATHSADNTTSTSFTPGAASVIISAVQSNSNGAVLNGDMTQDTDGWHNNVNSLFSVSGYNDNWTSGDATISCTNTLRAVFAVSWK